MSPHRARRSQVLAVLVLLISVSLCAAAVRASDDPLKAHQITGTTGQQIAVNEGWVRVDDVNVAQTLLQRDEVIGRTAGLFVVLRITLGATGPTNLRFNDATLVTEDRTYDRWTGTLPTAITGFSSSEQLAFEVDPDEIDDLTLTLRPGSFIYQYDELVTVSLGITSDNAGAWRQAGQGRTITLARSGRTAALP